MGKAEESITLELATVGNGMEEGWAREGVRWVKVL